MGRPKEAKAKKLHRPLSFYIEDDKRLIPEFGSAIWATRLSEKQWHYCKYCRHEVPTFCLTEGEIGSDKAIQVLRCCWECGSGLEVISPIATGKPL